MTPVDDEIIGGLTEEKNSPKDIVIFIIFLINMSIGLIISLGMTRGMRGVIGYIMLLINIVGVAITLANKR